MLFGACPFVLWFVEEELRGPPTIFAPSIVAGVLPEVPCLFLAGFFIKKFGPGFCICFGVLIVSLRLLAYSFLSRFFFLWWWWCWWWWWWW
jgi:hypothetical protein